MMRSVKDLILQHNIAKKLTSALKQPQINNFKIPRKLRAYIKHFAPTTRAKKKMILRFQFKKNRILKKQIIIMNVFKA